MGVIIELWEMCVVLVRFVFKLNEQMMTIITGDEGNGLAYKLRLELR